MGLNFQVPVQYCSLQHQILLSSPDTFTMVHCFCFGPAISFFSGAISSSPLLFPRSILDTFRPGGLIFQCHIFSSFYTVHEILRARILGWLDIPFSSRSHFVRTLCYDPSVLGGPTQHGLELHQVTQARAP